MANQQLIKQAHSIMSRMINMGIKTDGEIWIQDAKRAWNYVIEKIERGDIKPKKKK